MKLPHFLALLLLATTAFAQAPVRPLVDGKFTEADIGKAPQGWKASYPQGGVVVKEGNDIFLRLTSKAAENAGMGQDVAIPAKATKVTVLGRMRGKPQNLKKEKRAAVEVCLRYKDAKGGNMNAAVITSENSPAWHTFNREFDLPPGAKTVEVVARSLFAIGTFDFDEVRVEFR